eukprot:836862-Rhodomonas_salina.2
MSSENGAGNKVGTKEADGGEAGAATQIAAIHRADPRLQQHSATTPPTKTPPRPLMRGKAALAIAAKKLRNSGIRFSWTLALRCVVLTSHAGPRFHNAAVPREDGGTGDDALLNPSSESL